MEKNYGTIPKTMEILIYYGKKNYGTMEKNYGTIVNYS